MSTAARDQLRDLLVAALRAEDEGAMFDYDPEDHSLNIDASLDMDRVSDAIIDGMFTFVSKMADELDDYEAAMRLEMTHPDPHPEGTR